MVAGWLEKSPVKKNETKATIADGVGKIEIASFLSYLRSASGSKCAAVQSQSERVLADYKTMSSSAKKDLISNFSRSGGKRAGLNSCFSQVVKVSEDCKESDWTGYATPDKLLELHSVTWA